jgi:hypothetical protein
MESPKTGIIIGAANSVAILGTTLYFYQRCAILADELQILQKELEDLKKKSTESTTAVTGKLQEIVSHINVQGEFVKNKLREVDIHSTDIKKIQRRMKAVKLNADSSKEYDSEEEDEDQKELKKIQARIEAKKQQKEGKKVSVVVPVQVPTSTSKKHSVDDDDDDVSVDLNAVKKS